ncbi:hypothetical protein O6H91_10G067600 [Diphasiastrum complanatum]|nr:hypothetical protein O6H91_10G067600 [Diphasiastrum complanatum]
MITKHGIVFEAENHKRCMMYRLRTSSHVSSARGSKAAGSHAQEQTNISSDTHILDRDKPQGRIKKGSLSDRKRAPDMRPLKRIKTRHSGPSSTLDHATVPIVKQDSEEVGMETLESVLQAGVDIDIETIENVKNSYGEPECNDLSEMTDVKHFSAVPADVPLSGRYPSLYRVGQPYPCVTVTTTSVQRERRILERLEREKFIVRAELHRWLEDQENRTTMMDRKTLTRVLQKLQRENRCKCVLLNMPGSTNCGRNRTTEVILLPSIVVQPDLLCRIHESVRKFEIQSRANCVSRGKKSNGMFPVLTGVKRMSPSKPLKRIPTPSGSTLEKAGSMQANGFVPAKMVRVRMLHLFLWDYVSGLCESDGKTNLVQHNITEVTTGSYKVFALGAAMQAIPLESFLQIVGSTKKFENLADRVKRGLRLCDLPAAEHAELMDGNARGRLSWLVDVLRRLKLVRLVVGSGPILQPRKQVTKTFLSTIEAALTYAMEIHPFIEEPASELLPALNPEVLDVTPRARHEFNFCNKDDVDAYWQTLEYFFSDAEPSIARQAFPGSNVPELFGLRSWTSLRVMSVDQRNELLKRIGAGGVERRISAQECAKIAKDLNLTLEQVLKVSYEKNQSFRLQSLQKPFLTASDLLFKGISRVGAAVAEDNCDSPREVVPSVSTCSGLKSDKYLNCLQAELESNRGQPDYNVSGEQETVGRVTQSFSTEQNNESKDDAESEEEMQEEYRVNHISVVSGLKPFRRKRFPWSDKLDRTLVVSYARQRALLGSRYNRVDWATLRDLPAPPVICRRRMAQLKSEPSIRFAIMNLCQLFSDRYEKHQQHIESLRNAGAISCNTATCPESTDISKEHQTGIQRYGFIWDDVEDHSIVGAVEEIIKGKALARRRIIAYTGSGFDNLRSSKEAESFKEQTDRRKLSSSVATVEATSDGELSILHHQKRSGSVKKSLANYPSLKRIKRKPSLNDRLGLEKLVRKSISVANAVEFIKLIYLNIPASEENVRLPKQFADGLRLFKEHDVFAAFNLLRQRDLVAFQQSTRAFTLSPKFYFNVSKSRFPEGTFEACANTSSWLNQKNTELQQDWIPFPLEIGCGQLLHLFQLATAGELSLSPSMPRNGIGESDEPTNLGFTKKKLEMKKLAAPVARSKTWDAEEGCETSRRERGFPGIQVNLHLASMPVPQLLCNNLEANMDADFTKECDNANFKGSKVFSTYNSSSLSVGYSSEETGETSTVAFTEFNLATCLEHWSIAPKNKDNNCVNCDLLRAAYQIVDQAGEDGVRIEQLAESLCNDGRFEFVNCAKVYAYIEALQSLNLVEQVNAYDHVRIVGMSHCRHYFFHINSLENEMPHSPIYLDASAHTGVRVDGKTALLMLEAPRHTSDSPKQRSITNLDSTCQHNEAAFSAKDYSDILNEGASEKEANPVPMLPWLTMDGCINSPLFTALLHRVIGIVVLNPGIMEDDLVKQLDVLNPQTSRQLLQVLELGGYLHVRMTQIFKAEAPYLLQNMIKQKTTEAKTSMERSYYPCSSFTSILSPITISLKVLMDD